ncbi:MAG: MFS transporter [Planctomycetales bacterium]|nr:MFS transporter [Planctomycetales bacterium]
MNEQTTPWYRELTRYHWFVLTVAALGWIFDCLDQQLFVLARPAAMIELVPETAELAGDALKAARSHAGAVATAVFLAGWATGGVFFGMLGDRIGRAKTMLITILLYSAFTGLSSLSTGVWDFSFYRFLTGLGVGGEFAVGVALVAEVMPNRARPYTLAMLQALSALGNISAALINMGLGIAEEQGLVDSPWRKMFLIGALPALLAVVVRIGLKEPEQWQKASHEGAMAKKLGSYGQLFENATLRRHALLGLMLACSGVIGLWGVGFFAPDLIRLVQQKKVAAEVYAETLTSAEQSGNTALMEAIRAVQAADAPAQSSASGESAETPEPVAAATADQIALVRQETDKAISGRLARWGSYTSILINIGAFFGMFGFGAVAERIGRKPTFAIALLAAFVSTVSVFWFLQDFGQFWMVPVMGFCQLSLFAGYAMYFPELFPTHLRSTGTSFCYNVGRFVAAVGPLIQAQLVAFFTSMYASSGREPLRYAGITMCSVFLLGLLALPFLPETRGKPLPE